MVLHSSNHPHPPARSPHPYHPTRTRPRTTSPSHPHSLVWLVHVTAPDFKVRKSFSFIVKKAFCGPRKGQRQTNQSARWMNLLVKTEWKTASPPRLDTSSSSNWYGLAVCGGIFFLAKEHMLCSFYGSKLIVRCLDGSLLYLVSPPTESRSYRAEKRRRYTLLSITNHCWAIAAWLEALFSSFSHAHLTRILISR